jgi:hypothetical protein
MRLIRLISCNALLLIREQFSHVLVDESVKISINLFLQDA